MLKPTALESNSHNHQRNKTAMPIKPDGQGQFITLLALEKGLELPIPDSNILFGSTWVISTTEHETETAIADREFNLIIIDMALAGDKLISTAKSQGCINFHTPIIALIDSNDSKIKKNLVDAGFDDCMTKPLTTQMLAEVIYLWRDNDILVSFFESIHALLGIFRHNNKVVLTLYRKLFEELPLQIEQIEKAINTKQYHQAIEATHQINASAKICYLKTIGDLANNLEACLLKNNYGLVEAYFEMLQKNIRTLISHQHSILEHLER